jgi:predicted amidohydrolase YtcJ
MIPGMRKYIYPAACFLLLMCGNSYAQRPEADLILFNGKILTVDPSFHTASALAVRGDRILAAGSDGDIASLAGAGTRRVDLKGRTVLPGLTDSHVHAEAAAMYEFDHPVPYMESIGDVLAHIKSRAEALPEGQWISLSQVFITRLREQRYPTREEMDRVAPKHPVVFRTGPDASLNTLALKLCGIDRNFQIADGQAGKVERDAKTGEPTGILRNCARFIRYKSGEKTPSEADRRERLKRLLADYNSVGITSIVEANTSDSSVELLKSLKDRGELTCRTFMILAVDAAMPLDKIEARIEAAAKNPLHSYDNMLWLRGAKSFLDGGMLTGSAYMLQPWGVSQVYSIDDPQYRGMLFIEPDKLYRIMKAALSHNLQFAAHTVGDGAVHAFIDAAERVNADFPVRDKRPNISHANFMSRDAIERMRKLGVVANMQPAWLYLDGATLLKQFGSARLEFFQPYRAIIDRGVMVGGGSDHMQKIGSMQSINPYNPFLGIWATVAREPRWMAGALHAEQKISREEAIRFYTVNNAFLTFEEKEKGSLEPGRLADFIVLDRDIMTCKVDEIRSIEVLETYLGGKLVYRKP